MFLFCWLRETQKGRKGDSRLVFNLWGAVVEISVLALLWKIIFVILLRTWSTLKYTLQLRKQRRGKLVLSSPLFGDLKSPSETTARSRQQLESAGGLPDFHCNVLAPPRSWNFLAPQRETRAISGLLKTNLNQRHLFLNQKSN